MNTFIETPVWAWGALIAAVVLGILAALGWMRRGKPEISQKEPVAEANGGDMDAPET